MQIQKVSPNLKVLLHLQVFSRRQPRRHAVLPNVPWSTRTLVSWLCTPSYDGTLDEPKCNPCSLASRSTSHHELFALAKMVLNLKDFPANPIKLSNARLLTSSLRCSRVSRRTVLTCTTPPGVPIKCASDAECRPNQTPVPHRGSYLCVIRSASYQ